MKFLVFAFLWIACLHAVNALDFYTKKTGIVDLHSGNFRKLVKSGSSGLPWIVEFYAPWCGHCQQLKPEYIRMAAKLKGIVNVGAVDCDNKQNGMIASEYGIKGFPTIKVITADGKVHDYNGPRTSGGMSNFVLGFLDSKVQTVTSSNEEKFLTSEPALPKFILFTDKPKTTPLYQSLSAQLQKKAILGEVKKDSKLQAKYNVNKYPSLFVVPANEVEPKQYEGEITPDGIRAFIKTHVPSFDEPSNEPEEPASKGKDKKKEKSKESYKNYNVQLTAANFDSLVMNSDSVWIVEFFAPWCGHCKALAPEWQKAADSLKGIVKFGAVDATVEQQLAARYGIKGYPTIKVFPATKEAKVRRVSDYNEARTAQALSTFAVGQLPNLVATISPEEIASWYQNSLDFPKFLLVTDKASVPPLFKSIALEFNSKAKFGAILKGSKALLDQITGGSSALNVPALLAIVGKEQPQIQAYSGILGLDPISQFVRHLIGEAEPASSEAGASSSSSFEKDEGIIVVRSQKEFEQACTSRLGLCVVAFPTILDGEWENKNAYAEFEAVKQKLKSKPFHFIWLDVVKQRALANELRIPEDGSVGLAAIHPGKKRYAVFVGVFDQEGVSEFLDNLTRGKIFTSTYETLPAIIDEEQASKKDADSCSSDTSEESGQCSMPPKDEL